MKSLIHVVFVVWLGSCSEDLRPASMDQVTYVVYEEFIPYRVMEQNLYRMAGRSDVGLCPAVRAEESQTGELESMLKAAAREGVPVNAWLLLSEEDGYWFNEENLPEAREQVFSFLDWVEARREFGTAGIMALGIVGDVGMVSEDGYTQPADLSEDVAAAYAGGSERVYIYSLDGMLTLENPDDWLDVSATAPKQPEPDEVTGQARELIGLMDNLF